MDIVDELRAFVATAQTGSFTAAADQLGVSNRLTSKYVAALEARLGTRLLQRTTRKVGLTPSGEGLLARAPAFLDDFDELLSDVAEGPRRLSGTIRISAPVTFGETYVVGMIERFGEQHPDLAFDLRLSDGFVDLASDGFDLAIRMGQSNMLSLKTRRLGLFRSALVASPDYVAQNGAPSTPADLSQHQCIVDTNRNQPRRWTFSQKDNLETIDINGRFSVNSARGAVQLAKTGLGIAYVPRFVLSDALNDGSLVPLLEVFTEIGSPLSAVYIEGRVMPRKVRALIDFAAQDIVRAGIL